MANALLEKAEQDYRDFCEDKGLEMSWLGETLNLHGKIFKIVGLKPKSPKNAVVATEISTGNNYVLRTEEVIQKLKQGKEEFIPEEIERILKWNEIFQEQKGGAKLSLDNLGDIREIAQRIGYLLSPENLTCDGELSRNKVRIKEKGLLEALSWLEKKSGESYDKFVD
jgi:hypothetical protein